MVTLKLASFSIFKIAPTSHCKLVNSQKSQLHYFFGIDKSLISGAIQTMDEEVKVKELILTFPKGLVHFIHNRRNKIDTSSS